MGLDVSERDLYWLAGWLEGEGSFMPGPPSQPRCSAITGVTTDRDVAERVGLLWGTTPVLRRAQHPHHRDSWQVRLRGSLAVALMRQLRPLMGARRQEQIDAALASARGRPRRRVVECGTLTAYRRGCRCAPCKAVKAAEHRARQQL